MRTLLGRYPHTAAIHSGAVAGPPLEIVDVAVPNTAFKRVVRDLEFDVAELALMTYLMARSRGAPLCLLPVVLFSRNPLPLLVKRATDRDLGPATLKGRRLGVRSFTTTTAVWARRLLIEDCASDVADALWMTVDEGHVAGVVDPPNVRRLDAPGGLATWLADGTIDVAIVDPVPNSPDVSPLVPDAETRWNAWRARTGATTVNHVVVVRESLTHDAAGMRALFGLFRESRRLATAGLDDASTPLGFDAVRRHLDVAITAAMSEGLLARSLTLDDLVPASLRLE